MLAGVKECIDLPLFGENKTVQPGRQQQQQPQTSLVFWRGSFKRRGGGGCVASKSQKGSGTMSCHFSLCDVVNDGFLSV